MANTPWLAGSRIQRRSCCRVSQGRDSVRRSSELSIFGLRVRHAARAGGADRLNLLTGITRSRDAFDSGPLQGLVRRVC